MISTLAVLGPKIYSDRPSLKEHKVAISKTEYCSKSALETPNAFYNRQLFAVANKSSGINFGHILRVVATPKVEWVSDFLLRDVPGFHCPCCGKLMYTYGEITKFAVSLSTAKGKDISNILKPTVENLHTVEAQVAQTLIDLSEKNPDKDIKELLMLKRPECKEILEREQTKIIDSAIEDTRTIGGLNGKELLNKFRMIKTIISQGKGDGKAPFKRKKVVDTINKYTEFEQNPRKKIIMGNIAEKIQALPMSGKDFNAFVLKYTQEDRGDFEIAERIFKPNLSTKEHVKPAFRNTENVEHGANDKSNYLSMDDCNNLRGTEEYYLIAEKTPEFNKNLQIHMDEVQNYIIKEKLVEYYSYPLEIRRTIREQSTPPRETKPKLDFNTSLIEKHIKSELQVLKKLSQKSKEEGIYSQIKEFKKLSLEYKKDEIKVSPKESDLFVA